MKRQTTLYTILMAGVAACAVAFAATATAAIPVTNVTLAKSGDFTEVTVPVPSHQLCEHFTEPATAERPFRIVLNICNAEHAMAQQNFSNLPSCVVQKIRTSQYASAPEAVVRVVLDLKSSATYTVRTESDRLVVAIADNSPAFAAWEASNVAVLAKTETQPTTQPVKPERTDVAARPQINPPASAASEQSTATPSQSLVLAPTKQKTSSEVEVPSVTVTVEDLLGPAAKSEPPVVRMDTEESNPAGAPRENFQLPSQPLVLSPQYLEAGNAVPSADAQEAKTKTPSVMPGFAGNTPQVATVAGEPPMLAASTQPTDVTLPPTASSGDTLTGQDALIEKLKNKFFSGQRAPKPYLTEQGILVEQLKSGDPNVFGPPSPGSDMDREALLERIRQAALNNENFPANVLPSLPGGPVRAEVFYDDLGRRDPFEPLLKGLRSGFLSDELPSVEALRMVGVLKDDDQALALMEDTDGHSYIMRPGDPVANGRVLSVGESRTVIQVDEYGWTRTVVLQLTTRGTDPSKSLGANTLTRRERESVTEKPADAPAAKTE